MDEASIAGSPKPENSSATKAEPVMNGHSSPLKRRSPDDDLQANGSNGQSASAATPDLRRSKRARINGPLDDAKGSSSATGSPAPVQPTNGDDSKTDAQARRSYRKRSEKDDYATELETYKPPYAGITADEKRSWKGWCEIDSEPAFFNVMLKDLGVNGVRVREIYSLDPDMLAILPQPIYGLIFLFQYTEEDESDGEQEACPSHLWFANQVASNACGSYALLNIVNNIPNVDLGKQMQDFREHTKTMAPADRGTAVANCDFIRQVHNTFARTIEVQNVDACLEDDMEKAAKKGKKKPAKKSKKKAVDNGAAFHFIAYVPVQGQIWKMDGLDRQPCNLGESSTDNWIDTIASVLAIRMSTLMTGDIEFNMLALVKDPVVELHEKLATNVKLIRAVETKLNFLNEDWKMFAAGSDDYNDYVTSTSEELGLTQAMLDQTRLTDRDEKKLSIDNDTNTLIEWRERIIKEQGPLRANIREEMQSLLEDEAKAKDRRSDYGPVIQTWLNELAANEVLREMAKTK